MPIRILHIVDTLSVGGLQNGLANLIQRMDPARFTHLICAMRPVPAESVHPVFAETNRLICLPPRAGFSLQIRMLVRAILDSQPDIVHTRNWGTFEGVLAGRWAGCCAAIHSEHGVDSDTVSREPWRRIKFRRLVFEMADSVLSVSHQLRDLHAKRTGFPADRITVIHNGVDSRRFAPDPAARERVRGELGIAEDEFCIGAVGNLLPVKDHLTLLRAVAALPCAASNWRLLIVGDGPEMPRLRTFAHEHPNCESRVMFLGKSNRVPEFLNALDVYTLCSTTEGISNSVLEAMSTGLPVVVSDTGGNPEVVVNGESGLLFTVGSSDQLADHLLGLYSRPEQRVQLGQGAIERVRREFSLDAMVQKYEEVYQSASRVPAVEQIAARA